MGLQCQSIEVRDSKGFDSAFEAATKERAQCPPYESGSYLGVQIPPGAPTDFECLRQFSYAFFRVFERGRVFPLRADAHKLPYAAEFFDVITAHDCYSYFGTDDLYLNYLVQFVNLSVEIGIAGAGRRSRILRAAPAEHSAVLSHNFWCLHSANWWRSHWSRTGLVDVEKSGDSMPNASRFGPIGNANTPPTTLPKSKPLNATPARTSLTSGKSPGDTQALSCQPYAWPDGSFTLPHLMRRGQQKSPYSGESVEVGG